MCFIELSYLTYNKIFNLLSTSLKRFTFYTLVLNIVLYKSNSFIASFLSSLFINSFASFIYFILNRLPKYSLKAGIEYF